MKLPKRFALSTLLLAMLLVSLTFGYAQWRKRNLLSRVAELNQKEGLQIIVSEDWFWPEPLSEVVISYSRDSGGRYFEGNKLLTSSDLLSRYERLSDELKEIGVPSVSLALVCEKKANGGVFYYSMEFDGMEELRSALKTELAP
jgi:hypothetical protein